jgi:CHAT domain-containing protein/tetratricopeptide (TPR) repeat protein
MGFSELPSCVTATTSATEADFGPLNPGDCFAATANLEAVVLLAVWIAVVCYSPALASTPSTTSTQEPPPPARIRDLLDDGRYAEAETLARIQLSERESDHGEDTIEVAEALDLLVEARWHHEYADEATLELARRAVAIKERLLPPEDARLAGSLSNLCRILTLRGEYSAAQPICELSLSIAEKAPGPGHQDVAKSLSALGDLLAATGDYSGSRHLYERASAILEKEMGPDDAKVARSLWGWAVALRGQADTERAWDALARALSIQEKTLRADHPAVADTLDYIARVHWDRGELAEATRVIERAARIAERGFSPHSPRLATILTDLAISRMIYDRDFSEARRLLERVLAIYKETFGMDSRQFAWGQGVLGVLLTNVGDYEEAERLITQSLHTLEKVLGSEHFEVAWAHERLGRLAKKRGDRIGSSLHLRRSLAIGEKALGPDHPYVAWISIFLGQGHQAVGEYAEAEALYRKALRIYEKQAPESDRVGGTLINIADLLEDTSRQADAVPIYERAMAIRERVWGPEHPFVASGLAHFAEAQVRSGDARRGFALALQAEEIGRNHLRLTARVIPERQALRYAAVRQSGLDLALSVATHTTDPSMPARVWDALIRSRALIMDEVAARRRFVGASNRPETRSLYADLAAARQRLANLTIRGPARDTPEQFRTLLDGARKDKERTERLLAEASVTFRGERAREMAGLAEVRSALPPGWALVAFARYLEHEIPGGQSGKNPGAPQGKARAIRAEERVTPCYAAFVMQAGEGDPHLVRLGKATEIDSLVSRWRREIDRGGSGRPPKELEAEYRAAGVALKRRIWDPLAVHLGQPGRVVVVQDGTLNLVNLGALPAEGERYLIETGPLIRYLSAERDLVPRLAQERKGEGILALGGPAFDDTGLFTASAAGPAEAPTDEPENMANLPTYRGRRSTCGDFQSMRFAALPDSEREVKEVTALWRKRSRPPSVGAGGNPPVIRLIGAQASETEFKAKAPGRQVIHLATHGFFLGDKCVSALDASHASGGPARQNEPEPPPVVGENPLLLSGLALAGANHRATAGPQDDDGILTAEEVAAMDLAGVDWVVLSACDTGVGEYRAGEGMFGLRRAFQVAGARTVITSLWPVEDGAARALMRNLYQERLGGASTAEAVRNADLKMIERLKRSGLPAHPYFWGAFVAVGD